jgi:hypothetical protein
MVMIVPNMRKHWMDLHENEFYEGLVVNPALCRQLSIDTYFLIRFAKTKINNLSPNKSYKTFSLGENKQQH